MFFVQNINFSYGVERVLDNVSFEVKQGDWLGLLGPNGSGKTTLIKCLSRLCVPQSGTIRLLERPLNDYSVSELAKVISVVPQDLAIPFPFTANEVVLMGRSPFIKNFGFETKKDIAKAKMAMEATDTLQFAGRRVSELSGGERQRVIIARSLAQEPKILLLDEPTSQLDIKHQQEVLSLLGRLSEENGITIVSAIHDINLAISYCKTIMFLDKGRVFKCGPTNAVVTYANLKSVFDTEVYVGINDMDGRPYYLPMVKNEARGQKSEV